MTSLALYSRTHIFCKKNKIVIEDTFTCLDRIHAFNVRTDVSWTMQLLRLGSLINQRRALRRSFPRKFMSSTLFILRYTQMTKI